MINIEGNLDKIKYQVQALNNTLAGFDSEYKHPLHNLFACISLCHVCFTIEKKTKSGFQTEYSGPSVDEVCLLTALKDLNCTPHFLERDPENMRLV